MKNLFLILVVFTSMALGCKKPALLTTFTVSDSENFTIPPNSILTLPSIITPPFSTTAWQSDFSNNNTDANHITKVTLKSLTLTITSPPGKTFGFVKSIDVYIQAPNQEDLEVADMDNIPASQGPVLNMNTINADLSSYVKASSFTLRIETTLQQYNSDNVNVTADMSFNVTANVL